MGCGRRAGARVFHGKARSAIRGLHRTLDSSRMPAKSAAVFPLRPGKLTLADLRALYESNRPIRLDRRCWAAVKASADTVQAVIRERRTVYGVNTGFGKLARTRIADDQVSELQRRLVLSHAPAPGRCSMTARAPGPDPQDQRPRARPLRRPAERARGAGRAGQCRRPSCVPAKGSVGASGDLAPLAHMTARADRRRRGAPARPHDLRGAGPQGRRAGADRARRQGRPGAAQRHAGLDRARRCRPLRGRGCLRRRARRRRARASMPPSAATRRSMRASTPCAASPARSRWPKLLQGLLARQRDPQVPHRLRPRAGPLFAALPAAGDGRRARPCCASPPA